MGVEGKLDHHIRKADQYDWKEHVFASFTEGTFVKADKEKVRNTKDEEGGNEYVAFLALFICDVANKDAKE